MPLNAGVAMYYNLAAAWIARVRGWPTAVHHHVYGYLKRRDWRLQLLDRLMRRRGLHLLLCTDMLRRLDELYAGHAKCALVPSTITLVKADSAAQPPQPTANGRFVRRLGHISNLTEAKGAVTAIRTFAALRDEGHDVEMVVAGPITEPVVEREIRLAQERFRDSFDYRGPVYGAAKQAFFEDIDVLLFPSTFRLEAQPIVLSESFAYGKPALSFGISCIPALVDNVAWHVCPRGDFVAFAAGLVKQWRERPDEYAAAQRSAHKRAAELQIEARQSLLQLAAWACGEVAREFTVG
jgi:glycosyltransferase involved in cell wall biosynthesis